MHNFANSEDPDEMQLDVSTLFVKVKMFFRQKNIIFFENYNLTPVDICTTIDYLKCIVSNQKEEPISIRRVNFSC